MLTGVGDHAHDHLVTRATQGDSYAIAELLTRNLDRLRLFVRLKAGRDLLRHEPSEDLVQTVCRDVLANADGFAYRGEAAFRRWLCLRVTSKILDKRDYLHRERRDVRRNETNAGQDGRRNLADVLPAFLTPTQIAVGAETVDRLERAFALLSEDQRRVITFAKIFGLTHAQIAEEMERSQEATRALLSRALARLGILLSDPHLLDELEKQASE